MTAYEQEMEALRTRVAVLEVKLAATDESFFRGFKRIESLEKSPGIAGAVAMGMDNFEKRIEALEKRPTRVEVYPDLDESARQDRWHATRDAVLPAIAATAVDHGMTDAECVHDAARFADAAHGPLEAKAALCTHENYSCVKERQEVEALVRESSAVADNIREEFPFLAGTLDRVLKPFEAVKP